jgi:hypothetical protein
VSCITAPLQKSGWHPQIYSRQTLVDMMTQKSREHIWNFYGQVLTAVIGAIAVIVAAVIAIKYTEKPPEQPHPQQPITAEAPIKVAGKPVPPTSTPAQPTAPPASATRSREVRRTVKTKPQPQYVAAQPLPVAAQPMPAPPQTIIKQACVIENTVINQTTTQDCTGVTQ